MKNLINLIFLGVVTLSIQDVNADETPVENNVISVTPPATEHNTRVQHFSDHDHTIINTAYSIKKLLKNDLHESYDPVSGAFALQYTDIDLPGNGTLPLKIVRVYNELSSQNPQCEAAIKAATNSIHFGCAGLWTVGPATPRIVPNLIITSSSGEYLQFAVYMPNGTPMKMFPLATGKHRVFQSATNWTAKTYLKNSKTFNVILVSPKGVRYEYIGSREGAWTDDCHLQRITDLYGNWIHFEYYYNFIPSGLHEANISYFKRIISSDGRIVNFNYRKMSNSEIRTSITANNATWWYDYSIPPIKHTNTSSQSAVEKIYTLHRVTMPEGKIWKYSYSLYQYNNPLIKRMPYQKYALRAVTSPTLLKTFYQFNTSGLSGVLPPLSRLNTSPPALLWKKVITPKQTAQLWTYQYTTGKNDGQTIILGPTSSDKQKPRKLIFHYTIPEFGVKNNHDRYPAWQYGLIDSIKYVNESGHVLGSESYRYTQRFYPVISDFSESYIDNRNAPHITKIASTPLLTSHIINLTHFGKYITTYSHFDKYGRPQLIKEQGDNNKSRITQLTYYTNLKNQVVNGILTKKINGILAAKNSYYETGQLKSRSIFGVTTQYHYNSQGNLDTLTDANSHVTIFSNYFRGKAQITQLANGSRITKKINRTGTVSSETDPNNHTTKYTYDKLNRILSVTDPNKTTTHYTYDSPESGPGGTTSVKNNLKEIIKINAYGNESEIEKIDLTTNKKIKKIKRYDRFNHLSFNSVFFDGSQINSEQGIYYKYDELGRLTSLHSPCETCADTDYNYLPNHQLSITDARHHRTINTYQSYGNPKNSMLIRIDQPEGVTTTINRDCFGHINFVKQGNLTRTYSYDSHYFISSLTEPELGTTFFTHDKVGNTLTKKNGDLTTSYRYNLMNSPQQIAYSDGSPSLVKSYYEGGQLKTVDKDYTHLHYTYNANNQLTDETIQRGTQQFTFHYEYNLLGSLARMTYPDGKIFEFNPNAFGKPTQIGHLIKAIRYYPTDIVKSMQYANGIQATTTLNDNSLPKKIAFSSKNFSIDRIYNYDKTLNVTSIKESHEPHYNLTLGYDGLNRLVTANGPWGKGVIAYNDNGDLIKKSLGSDQLYYELKHGVLNRITGTTNRTFTYDQRGNVTDNGVNQFVYAADNTLVILKDRSNHIISQYTYDGLRHRLAAHNKHGTLLSLYNQAGMLLYEQNNTTHTTHDYLYLQGHKVAQLDTTPIASNVIYFHNNLLGSPIAATDANGTLMWQQHYQPYGKSLNKAITAENHQWYTGKTQDNESGLLYYGARYYDPTIGRFMATDPRGFNDESPITFNRYAYAANNPYRYVDPTGEEFVSNWNNGNWSIGYDSSYGFFGLNQAQFDEWIKLDTDFWYYASCGHLGQNTGHLKQALANLNLDISLTGGYGRTATYSLSIGYHGISYSNTLGYGRGFDVNVGISKIFGHAPKKITSGFTISGGKFINVASTSGASENGPYEIVSIGFGGGGYVGTSIIGYSSKHYGWSEIQSSIIHLFDHPNSKDET